MFKKKTIEQFFMKLKLFIIDFVLIWGIFKVLKTRI